jgi:hypothetical protein
MYTGRVHFGILRLFGWNSIIAASEKVSKQSAKKRGQGVGFKLQIVRVVG